MGNSRVMGGWSWVGIEDIDIDSGVSRSGNLYHFGFVSFCISAW